MISDHDIQRLASAVTSLLVIESHMIEQLQTQITSLQKENEYLKQKVNILYMYSRRSCLLEERDMIDDVVAA